MDEELDLDVCALMREQEDIEAALAVAAHLSFMRRHRSRVRATRQEKRPRYRGSARGRQNKPRDFAFGMFCILSDSFGVNGAPPVYSEAYIERRFRVPRAVLDRVYRALKDRLWWAQKVNATGQRQAHPLQKLVAAFPVLGYGEATDRADKYCSISSTAIKIAVKMLVVFIGDEIGGEYLRPPNDVELDVLLKRNAERAMPGCIESLHCSQW